MKNNTSRFSIMLVLVIAMLCMVTTAFAVKQCPDHPYAQMEVAGTQYDWSPYSVIRHRWGFGYVCTICKRGFYDFEYDFHTYANNEGGKCIKCGWQRPTKSDLAAEAWGLVSTIDQRSGWVLYESNVYSEAGGSSKCGSVTVNQQVRIIDHKDVNGILWCKVCNNLDINNPLGWVSSQMISIDKSELIGNSGLVGQTVRIKVSSGRARTNAGDYPVVEYVHLNEKYTVLDQKTGTDGKTWIQIKVDGNYVWISAGLVETGY